MAGAWNKGRESSYRSRRAAAIGAARRQHAVDAVLVSEPADVSYLTGFTGDDSVLVLADRPARRQPGGWACLVTDGRYSERAGRECPDVELLLRKNSMPAAIAQALASRRVRRLGVQAERVTLAAAEALAKAIGGRKIRPISGLTDRLREVKDADELRAIGKAVRLAERAFRELIAGGARALVGRTERQVAAELDYRMRRLGASGAAFETMVAAGASSSNPHYSPADVRIRAGQAVLFDWGAMADGYCSDLTRVVFTGRIPLELVEPYEVVLRAQAAGIAAVRPGAACRTVDTDARDVVCRAGYGDRFVHSLGHGVGRQVHEGPALSGSSRQRLREGMVVTVEPGIYLPGVGGIRIEDDVLVTAGGQRRLSSLPRRPAAMILR